MKRSAASFFLLLVLGLPATASIPDDKQALTAQEIINKHLEQPLPLVHDTVSDVPRAVDTVIQKATAKNREHRYSEVLALALDFRKACRC